MADHPCLPVAPRSTSSVATLLRARERELHAVDEHVIASLVRSRLTLERARGWLLLSGLVATVGAVVVLGLTVRSKLALSVLAPLVASVPFGIGFVADRVIWLCFERLAQSHGLSEQASKRIYEGAIDADHWIDVLTSCGRPPSDLEVARFVCRTD